MGCNESKPTIPTLLDEIVLSETITLKNRFVMAAMTRGRSNPSTNVANDLNAKYYSQRAGFGLILTECSAISARGNGYYGSAAIFNDEQQAGWKKVVDAVHKENGKIFLQIVHCGRVATEQDMGGKKPLGPSALSAGQNHGGSEEYPVPDVITLDQIKEVIQDFKTAATRAIKIGFDGVEIHGANGYLIDQFLRSKSNKRTDDYGGSVENRAKFALEVIDAVIEAVGANRTSIKLSPAGGYNDMMDENPIETYQYLLGEIEKRKILFVEITNEDAHAQFQDTTVVKALRPFYKGKIIANAGFDFEKGNKALEDGDADMVSFAKLAIRNPDLPQRYRNQKTIDEKVDYTTMFFGSEEDYTTFKNAD